MKNRFRMSDIIKTKRLILSTITLDDSPHFLEYLPDIDQYLSLIAPKDLTEAKQLMQKYLEDMNNKNSYYFSIRLKENQEFIGVVGVYDLNKDWPDRHCWIKKKAQRKGYAFEAISAFMKWANENLDYTIIYSSFDASNPTMELLNKKLGGVKGNTIPKPVDQGNGKTLQILWYEYKNPKYS